MKTEKEYQVVAFTPSGRTRSVAELFKSIEEARARVEYLKRTTIFKDSKFKIFEVEKTYTLIEEDS